MRIVTMYADDRAVFAAHRVGNRPLAYSFALNVEMKGCPGFPDRPEWDDATTPRTDDPVYFNTMTRGNGRPYTHRASDN